jgi:hypothetical protein
MAKLRIATISALVLAACMSYATYAHAFDLTGLWATDDRACDKIFAKAAGKTSLRKDSDMFGGGFIVEGKRIRGRMATCNITQSKEDGAVIHLMTSCATDIMLSNVQFSVKVLDDNRISRIFPGMDEMQLTYYRCPAR